MIPRPDTRVLDLGHRVPRADLTPLDLVEPPPVRFVVCPVCGGKRTGLGSEEYGGRPCNVCGGQGEIGGGA